MVARLYGEIRYSWDACFSQVSPNAKIDHTARLEPLCIIEDDVEIGANSLIGAFTHVRNGSRIGRDTVIGGCNIIEGRCKIGNNCRIQTHNCITYETEIEDMVFISGHFTGGNDKRMSWGRNIDHTLHGWKIKRGARIGVGVVLLPGITIGREAMIGAGSLVTKDVPDFAIWYGVPARHHGIVPIEERLDAKTWHTLR